MGAAPSIDGRDLGGRGGGPTLTSHLRGGALAGVLAAASGVVVGEAAASLLDTPSPLEAIGVLAVDRSPSWLRDWAISTFGAADKPVLVAGMVVVLALLAAAVGVLGRTRPAAAVAATVAVGVGGVIVAATGRTAVDTALAARVVPSVLTVVVSALALAALLRALPARRLSTEPAGQRPPTDPSGAGLDVVSSSREAAAEQAAANGEPLDRRRFLSAALAVGSVGAAGGVVAVRTREQTGAARTVPVPDDPAASLPAGTDLEARGMAPFHTPNDAFYRVDTALRIPRVDPASWRLRVHGMVDRELTLDLESLLARPMIERDITLTCVSNEVGDRYVGTARWIGARLNDLLAECGVQAGADAVRSTAVDGFTIGTPLAALTDGRDAMLAVAMNGEQLPPVHGYPARMVVPGLYGYVSATKWLVDLEVTRFADFEAYWTERGWAEQAPIKTSSRIDHPRANARLNTGVVSVSGVAWAQRRGIRAVEVRVDDGPWEPAELGVQASVDTWRQWQWDWAATAGVHEISVRATDETGETQTADQAPPAPDGATGWHTVAVLVFDGIPTGPPSGGIGGGIELPGTGDDSLLR